MKTTSYIFGIVAVGALLCSSSPAFGQDYDDIYYNPSKAKTQPKKEVKVTRSTTTTKTTTTYTPTPDYAASGTYDFNTGSLRDVDEYNRHSVTPSDNVIVQTGDTVIDGEEFQYTRRIERFHNPDVVVNTNDEDLIDYYYSIEPTASTSVNVYVNANPWTTWISPFTWSSPYYSYWNWGWYNSWYNPWYASYWPSLSWGWYDPWYSWSWGPTFGWGWGGGWYPGPPYPNHGWVNNWWPTGTGAGSSRPHPSTSRPAAGTGIASAGGGYNNNNAVRPGSGAGTITGNTPTTRPGNMGRGRTTYTTDNNGVVTSRPGSSVSGTNRWPASVNSSSSSSSTATRGRTTTAPATTTRQPATNTYNINNNTNRNTNTRTYNSNSNSTRSTYSSPGSSSRSSIGSGSSGSFGGGSHSSGGSGSRGRR